MKKRGYRESALATVLGEEAGAGEVGYNHVGDFAFEEGVEGEVAIPVHHESFHIRHHMDGHIIPLFVFLLHNCSLLKFDIMQIRTCRCKGRGVADGT